VLNKFAVLFAKFNWGRRLGIWASSSHLNFWQEAKGNTFKLFLEGILENSLNVFLAVIAIFELGDKKEYQLGDQISIVLALVVLFGMVRFPYFVYSTLSNNWQKIEKRKEYWYMVQGVSRKSRWAIFNNYFFMLRRIITAAVLIFMTRFSFF
jgi:hypothetical protein